eukprot:COSAG01_NODE_931_length_12617_cov_20.567163_11_plen_167_part_00
MVECCWWCVTDSVLFCTLHRASHCDAHAAAAALADPASGIKPAQGTTPEMEDMCLPLRLLWLSFWGFGYVLGTLARRVAELLVLLRPARKVKLRAEAEEFVLRRAAARSPVMEEPEEPAQLSATPRRLDMQGKKGKYNNEANSVPRDQGGRGAGALRLTSSGLAPS